MALQRFDILARDVRDATGNQTYSATQGVKQREIVRYGNAAQSRIYNKIADTHSTLFSKTITVDVVAGQDSYTLPTDVYLKDAISVVQFSFNGNPINYAPLERRTERQRVSVKAFPTAYFMSDGTLVLTPIPSQNAAAGLRISYQYALPTLDIRRGLITGSTVSTITLNSDATLIAETENDLATGFVDYLCVVDKDGVQVATGIPVTGYNSSTHVISCTLTSAQQALIVNNANYVVFGANATTHSPLVPLCERYLVTYMTLGVQMRDSNSESVDTSPLLKAIEDEIIASFEDIEEDILAVTILDTAYLNYADDL